MPTAREIVQSRLVQEQQSLQTEFKNQWYLTNRRIGPVSRNPSVETARRRALLNLQSQFRARADSLTRKYDAQFRSMNEIDAMVQSGMITNANPEELKMRSIVPATVERAMFPETEEEKTTDPLSEYGRFNAQLERLNRQLEDFEVVEPRAPGTESTGRKLNWYGGEKRVGKYEDPGGVGQGVYRKILVGYDDEGKPQYRRAPASKSELSRWAELTTQRDRVTDALRGIERSPHMQERMQLATTGKKGEVVDSNTPKQLTTEMAVRIYQEAGGDKKKAEEIARERGYSF